MTTPEPLSADEAMNLRKVDDAIHDRLGVPHLDAERAKGWEPFNDGNDDLFSVTPQASADVEAAREALLALAPADGPFAQRVEAFEAAIRAEAGTLDVERLACYQDGRAAALDEARAAVEMLPDYDDGQLHLWLQRDVRAAIDALREVDRG